MAKYVYIIVVKGRIPETLVERVSAVHARALLQSSNQATEEPGESTTKARVNNRDSHSDRKGNNAIPKPKRNGLNE
jgi:hypothetical protein